MIKGNEQRLFFKMADKLGVSLSNLKAAYKLAVEEVEAEDDKKSEAPIEAGQTTSDKFDNTTDEDTAADQKFNDDFEAADGQKDGDDSEEEV